MNPSPKLVAVLRRLLLAVAGLATLLGFLVVVENWRGNRAWAEEERALRAKGEPLELDALRPPPVPDDQNLFKSPLLARVVNDVPADAERKRIIADSRLLGAYDFGNHGRRLKDFFALRDSWKKSGLLVATYTNSPAADVLKAMQPMRPLLDELREAARLRPIAILAMDRDPLLAPTLDAVLTFRMAQALEVRACAEVELGRIDEAYADIYALQRCASGLAQHPTSMLCHLAGIAMHGIAAGAVSHGCERHVWTDQRLAEFQTQIGELHPLAGFQEALRLERAHMVFLLDAQPVGGTGFFPRWLPRGWLQQNKVTYCERLETETLSTFTTVPERIFPAQSATGRKPAGPTPKFPTPYGFIAQFPTPYGFIAQLAMPNWSGILGGVGTSADQLTLASVTWGIERYHVANGRYPTTLDELVPKFLPAIPNGLFDGQPPRYAELPSGGHQVYFIGVNSRDDGGNGDDIVIKLPDAS